VRKGRGRDLIYKVPEYKIPWIEEGRASSARAGGMGLKSTHSPGGRIGEPRAGGNLFAGENRFNKKAKRHQIRDEHASSGRTVG